jgi:hypothetical protein
MLRELIVLKIIIVKVGIECSNSSIGRALSSEGTYVYLWLELYLARIINALVI